MFEEVECDNCGETFEQLSEFVEDDGPNYCKRACKQAGD